LESNTTHFNHDELRNLLEAFKRMTVDRLQAVQFYQVVEEELGWTDPTLRKQLFRAFDLDGLGDVDFREFCEAYSVMLRGTVPELLDFAWRVYHIGGPPDRLRVDDIYQVLRLALAGLDEVRRKQGKQAAGTSEESRYPDRTARTLVQTVFGDAKQLVSKREFSVAVLRHRALVDCLVPGFELIPLDALHRAAEAGEVDEVRHLLEVDRLDVNGEDALQWPTTPLHLATRAGHADVVVELLTRGANPRLRKGGRDAGATALHLAVLADKHRALECILEAGADPLVKDGDGGTPLHTAAEHGNLKAVAMLLARVAASEGGADGGGGAGPSSKATLRVVDLKDAEGRSPIHRLGLDDHFAVLGTFVEAGVFAPGSSAGEVDRPDHAGVTALHVACAHRAFRVVKLLLELGADTRTVDHAGRSALHHAASIPGNGAVLQALLRHNELRTPDVGVKSDAAKDDVNRRDSSGSTPLLLAAHAGDGKMLKALLAQPRVDVDLSESSTGHTALHKAVLVSWFEGVEALVSAGASVLHDARGQSAYDYARTPEITDVLREYIADSYRDTGDPVRVHPVRFDFGLVFNDGLWRVAESGPAMGQRIIVPPRVNRAQRRRRIALSLVDRESVIRKLVRAGLFVHVDKVYLKEGAARAAKIRQFTLVRVGAPTYRVQLEATRMRLQTRTTTGEMSEFFVDQATFPETGFTPFLRGERQQVIMNIIEAPDAESPLASLQLRPTGGVNAQLTADGLRSTAVSVTDVRSAGIKVAQYVDLGVMHSFMVLHDGPAQAEVLDQWNLTPPAWVLGGVPVKGRALKKRTASLGPVAARLEKEARDHALAEAQARRRGYWRREFLSFVRTHERVLVRPLQAVFKYFGSKLAFYEAFVHHFSRALLVPAVAGCVSFVVLWIPRQDSAVRGAGTSWGTLTYDHPIAYINFVVLTGWIATSVRSWNVRQQELRARWRLDTVRDYPRTPNPRSTAVVRRRFVRGEWKYLPVTTPAMLRNRLRYYGLSAGLVLLFLAISVFTTWALVSVLSSVIDNTEALHEFYGTADQRRNILGTLSLYAATAAQAVAVYIINNAWVATACWLSHKMNFATLVEHDTALCVLLVPYMYINSTLAIYYLGYYSIDKTRGLDDRMDRAAAMVASIVVVGQIVSLSIEYGVPWLSQRRQRLDDAQMLSLRQGQAERLAKKKVNEMYAIGQGASIIDLVDTETSSSDVDASTSESDSDASDDSVDRDPLAAGLEDDAQDRMRQEILAEVPEFSVEFSTVLVQVAILMSFGAVWPLTSLALLLSFFAAARLDVWKFCRVTQRPLAERWPGIGIFALVLEALVILGIVSQSFFFAMNSESLKDYVLQGENGLTPEDWDGEQGTRTRLFMGFAAENLLLAVYFVIRFWPWSRPPAVSPERGAESLRTVREAYIFAYKVRERRYTLMAGDPRVTLRQVCRSMGVDQGSAERYLGVARYLDSLPAAERRAILLDTGIAVSSIVQRAILARRMVNWRDPGEATSSAALLKELVPIVDLSRAYKLGKEFREAVWRVWNANVTRLNDASGIDPDDPRVSAAIEQLAACDVGVTVDQARRYTRLCRYVDAMGANAWAKLDRMSASLPTGLLGFLATQRTRRDDPGDNRPSSIHAMVEPIVLARDAVVRAQALRRWMYEEWLSDTYLGTDELLGLVVLRKGSTLEACQRYLLCARYIETLDAQRAINLLEIQRTSTLALVLVVENLLGEGTWVDPGEPTFFDWVPEANPEAWEKEGWLVGKQVQGAGEDEWDEEDETGSDEAYRGLDGPDTPGLLGAPPPYGSDDGGEAPPLGMVLADPPRVGRVGVGRVVPA